MQTDTRVLALLTVAGYAEAIIAGTHATIPTPERAAEWHKVKRLAVNMIAGIGSVVHLRRAFCASPIVEELYEQVTAILVALGVEKALR